MCVCEREYCWFALQCSGVLVNVVTVYIICIDILCFCLLVILGWDKGVATMQRGEICVMKLAPEYAYGSGGVGPIPPNSTLIFELELVGWKEKSPAILGLPIERVGQLLGVIFCFCFAYFYFVKF